MKAWPEFNWFETENKEKCFENVNESSGFIKYGISRQSNYPLPKDIRA
jgi:hypothetical protein